MTDPRRGLGKTGERLAREQLEREGWRVRATNFRCPAGEIDIIAQDGECLVFVEVKTRRGQAYGIPEEGISAVQRRRLVAASESYLAALACTPDDWRIDLVAVEMSQEGRLVRLERIEHAIEG